MILAPSLMCADPGHYAREIHSLELAGANAFHLDVMDGEFVDNFALSWSDISAFKKYTKLPLDVHLMVKNLSVHLKQAAKIGVNTVFIHTTNSEFINIIQNPYLMNLDIGVVIDVNTDINFLSKIIPCPKKILMMRVHPGFAGQKTVVGLERFKAIKAVFPYSSIYLDGAVDLEVIRSHSAQGAAGFVLGTACLFNKKQSYDQIFNTIQMINYE